MHNDSLFVFTIKLVFFAKLIEVNVSLVCALAKGTADCCLSRSLRSDNERYLRKHSFTSLFVNRQLIKFTAHLSDFAKSAVEVNNRGGLHFVGFQSLEKNLFLIVRSLHCSFGCAS